MSSLACNSRDRTQVGPGNQGGAAGNTASAGAGGAAGSGGAAGVGGSSGQGAAGQGVGGVGGEVQCASTPWASFVEASTVCQADCIVCAADIIDDQPVHYNTMFGAGCACSSPRPQLWPDAGVSGPPATCATRGGFLTAEQALSNCVAGAGDAGACRVCPEDDSDAGLPRSWSVTRAECECPAVIGHECGSYPNLSEAEATALCAGLTDCRVCVQQTDPAGTAELWMAHACGCPTPYRRSE